ncbi:GtrA family protein [Sphingosinicella xenopeptidilytica]|uniref:GtrA family protein n=1 Tax=Sphingosinicella xenopeptidilytica TaxID=364098 RepID=A0ABW3C8P1_SPHXN
MTPTSMQVARFGIVGLLNTALGYLIILTGLALGWGDILANAAGYAVGLLLSFHLNRRWTFAAASQSTSRQWPLFALVVLAAYTCNLLIILVGAHFGFRESPILQFVAIITYSVVFFLLSKTVVFIDQSDAMLRGTSITIPLLVVMTGAALMLLPTLPLGHDVYWQFWIARQLLNGAELYRDILEINPPLWFWAASLITKVATAVDVDPLRLLVQLIILWSAAATSIFVKFVSPDTQYQATLLTIATFSALLLLPIGDFAQREHLALIAAVPYAALIAAREEKRAINPWLVAFVGIGAAFGFALKHYFVAVPLLLELWLLYRLRRTWRPFRTETVILGTAAVGYIFAIIFTSRDFLDVIVPMVALAYDDFALSPIKILLSKYTLIWFVGVIAIFSVFRTNRTLFERAILPSALLSFAGFSLSYFFQGKGWGYHAAPATSLLFVALAILLVGKPGIFKNARQHPLLIFALLLPVIVVGLRGPYKVATGKQTVALLQSAPAGTNVAAFLVNPSLVWPAIEQAKLKWSLRYYAFWMLPTITSEDRRGEQDLELLGKHIITQTLNDIACNPPLYIVVDTQTTLNNIEYNISTPLEFLKSDLKFRKFFDNYYKIILQDERLETYVLNYNNIEILKECRNIF